MFIKSLQLCFVILLVSGVAAWASPVGPARLQGEVKDSKGQPVAGAEVHIKGKDGSAERIVRTDDTGHYGIGKLQVTDYEVVLFVNGAIKVSVIDQTVYTIIPT